MSKPPVSGHERNVRLVLWRRDENPGYIIGANSEIEAKVAAHSDLNLKLSVETMAVGFYRGDGEKRGNALWVRTA